MSRQSVTTEAGNSNSAVIGILDETEVVRQKFEFERKVLLKSFTLSFGSFKKKDVGDTLNIQLLDGNNNITYKTSVPVKKIKAGSTYTVDMKKAVIVPAGVTCCINISCSSKDSNYEKVPTLNTTNRTDPNTYLSTLNMQTYKKSLNVSYTYTYGQVFPLVVMIFEVLIILLLIFERISEYVPSLRARAHRNKGKKGVDNKQSRVKKFLKFFFVNERVELIVKMIIVAFNPLVIAMIMESMNGTLTTILPNVWIFTWILIFAFELLFMAFVPWASISIVVMDILLFILGLVNFFVLKLRGTPFLPSDIMGAATAKEVADHYKFEFTPVQFITIVFFIIWIMVILKFRIKPKKFEAKKYILKAVTHVLPAFAIIAILYSTSILESAGIKDDVWNKVASCKKNGFYMNYFINVHYLKVSKPSGYSQDKVKEIIKDVKEDDSIITEAEGDDGLTVAKKEEKFSGQKKDFVTNADFAHNTVLNGEKPNIILIMNESFADFSLVNDTISYNKDPLPFIHSMSDNTIKGLDFVSVFGAGTSNSEFEAMTGNTMTYFPSGSNVYQQFMHSSTYSLPSYLKSLEYTTYAVHPSTGNNWNRIATYDSMKFDDFITIEDFKNPEYIRYISDKESYKKVIELYEKKKKDEKLYIFDMTIQGHGGYLTNTDWRNPIYVQNSYFDETKEFLSSTRVSDDAFKYLIDYFSKEKEPTIICMFGDHFPKVEQLFYEDLLGKEESDWELEDIQKRYGTPYILWANYDIPESSDIVLSNNYLENMLLKEAGIELPLYNKFIEKLSKQVPAMNVNGYMDKEGKWHTYDDNDDDELKKLFNDYKLLQYGYYSDQDKDSTSKIFEMDK
ncbi:MAG: sulfatase-like hydrolase/transferase [Lachnospiraceae bacterium]|nr:sulfatase-like hydrolase/transferase [Lachnospiraceae bacterium]